MPRNRDSRVVGRAQKARKDPSAAEAIMWAALRGAKTGFKFRREHPIGIYRLDFYCAEARLAVELDGEQHDPGRDQARDEFTASLGIHTHRIPNRRFFNLDEDPYRDEIAEIVKLCEARSGRTAFTL